MTTDPTLDTVRLALVCYALCVVLMPWLDRAAWCATTPLGRAVRLVWAVGCLAYLVHVGLAFHFHHDWSHARAMRHVAEQGGFGPGIFLSYLFTLAWTADALWWRLAPASYAGRPGQIGVGLHAFLFFMVFNATVVFATGPARWGGLALCVLLVGSLVLRFRVRLLAGGTS